MGVVFPGLWAWGNDRFSVWGQEMATLLSGAQWSLRCSSEASSKGGGGGRDGGQGKRADQGGSVIQGKKGTDWEENKMTSNMVSM